MTIHTVSSYEEDLNLLTNAVCKMGNLLHEMLNNLQNATISRKKINLDQAREIDKQINLLDIEIEEKSVALIALRQPMSIDLRQIIASLKSAVIIERMGDLTKNTVKRVIKVENFYSKEIYEDLDEILTMLKSMLSAAIKSYKNFDEKLALKVCLDDQKIDKLYKEILSKLQVKLVNKEENVDNILQVIFAVKNIERIGDYITKIAQMVPYIVKGQKVSKKEIKQLKNEDFF